MQALTITPPSPLRRRRTGNGLDRELERDLLLRAQDGDRAASDELARLLRPMALRMAHRRVRGVEDAQDLVQDGLLRFFTHLHQIDPGRPLLPWLSRIISNAAIDHHRRRQVRKAQSLDVEEADEPVSPRPSPESLTERRELAEEVRACLERLNESHREILVLREYRDLAYREIAETLGIPIGTVMSRLHAARAALRGELERSAASNHEAVPDRRSDHGGLC